MKKKNKGGINMSDKEKNNEQIPDLNELKQIKKVYK